MKNKKGQAAMEFLTTYGWAFLIIIIVLAGLYYMDVFNADRALTTGLTLDERLLGGDTFAIDLDNQLIAFEVKNMLDAPITITEVTLYEKSGANVVVGECKFDTFLEGSEIIPARNWGEVKLGIPVPIGSGTINLPDCGFEENAGQVKTFTMQIKYTPAGSSIETVSKGEMTVSVGTFTAGSTTRACVNSDCPAFTSCPGAKTCIGTYPDCSWRCDLQA
jgi:hypothetical protein